MASKAEQAAEIILAPLEQMLEDENLPPWTRGWKATGKYLHRGANDKPYNGVNQMITQVVSMIHGYESRRWWTFRAINEAGGRITKGESGTAVALYKPWSREVMDPETGEADEVRGMFLKYYKVWNLDQTNLPDEAKYDKPDITEAVPPIQACEQIVNDWSDCPSIIHPFDGACYLPSLDTVRMPYRDDFDSAALYYKTLFHEFGHATGHSSRLARKGVMDIDQFGSTRYGLEEIVAETTAAILSGVAGIGDIMIEDAAAYCQSWLQTIRADRRAFLRMAGHGVKAAQYILGETVTYDAPSEAETEQMVAA